MLIATFSFQFIRGLLLSGRYVDEIHITTLLLFDAVFLCVDYEILLFSVSKHLKI